MELEELKANWNAANARVDAMQATLNRTAGRRTSRRLMWEPIFELLAGVWTARIVGGFLYDNLSRITQAPLGALPAVLIDLCAIATIALGVRQLITISQIDYANPIVETQRHLGMLRKIRVRSTQWMLLLGFPLWIIFPIFAGQALMHYDLWRSLSGPWLLLNIVFGAFLSGTVLFAARRFSGRWSIFAKIEAALAGTAVEEAQKFLRELDGFAE